MSKDELIDEHVSLKQCRLAVDALHSHETERQEGLEENQLLPGKEPNIWLNVTVKKIPSVHRFKPLKVPIIHPLVDPRTTPVCLITKDPQRQYKDLLESHNIKFVSRVVGLDKLKGKFKPYEARRALLKENGLFLADERIIPLLPKLLGRKWFEAKKQPIPVCLTRKDLKGELERAISSTYMNQNQGTCTSIKIATLSQKPIQIVANIQKALPTIVNHIKGGWENVQSLNIKTNSSVSLPIWSCSLGDGNEGRWHGFTASDDEEDAEDEFKAISGDIIVDDVSSPKQSLKKGRKRSSSGEDESEDEDKPRKKAKAAKEPPVASKPPQSKPSSNSISSVPPSSKPTKKVTEIAETTKPQKRKVDGTKPKSSSAAQSKAAKPDSADASKKRPNERQSAISAGAKTPQSPDLQVNETRSPEKPGTGPKKKAKGPNIAVPPSEKRKGKKAESAPASIPTKTKSPSDLVSRSAGFKPNKATDKKSKLTGEGASSTRPDAAKEAVQIALTPEELKGKRISGGEKKKGKTVKSMGRKSAKDAVLGKKAGQA